MWGCVALPKSVHNTYPNLYITLCTFSNFGVLQSQGCSPSAGHDLVHFKQDFQSDWMWFEFAWSSACYQSLDQRKVEFPNAMLVVLGSNMWRPLDIIYFCSLMRTNSVSCITIFVACWVCWFRCLGLLLFIWRLKRVVEKIIRTQFCVDRWNLG